MTDGQWIPQSHDPESFRYGYNNVDNNYGTVPENYTTPIIDNHAAGFDYQVSISSTFYVQLLRS